MDTDTRMAIEAMNQKLNLLVDMMERHDKLNFGALELNVKLWGSLEDLLRDGNQDKQTKGAGNGNI